jgi:hypothetical protein
VLERLKLVPWSSWATLVPLLPALVFGQSYTARDHDARQAVRATERLRIEVQGLQSQAVALQAKQRRAETREAELVAQLKALQAVVPPASSGASAPAAPTRSYGEGSSTRDSDREADERRRRAEEDESRERQQREREKEQCKQSREICLATHRSCLAHCEGMASSCGPTASYLCESPRTKNCRVCPW